MRDCATRRAMPNPVVYFDIEIGGVPAGRIEMTVRAIDATAMRA